MNPADFFMDVIAGEVTPTPRARARLTDKQKMEKSRQSLDNYEAMNNEVLLPATPDELVGKWEDHKRGDFGRDYLLHSPQVCIPLLPSHDSSLYPVATTVP